MLVCWSVYAPGSVGRARPTPRRCGPPTVSGLPPALFVLAELDALTDEGLDYAERCRRAGVDVEVRDVAGHGSTASCAGARRSTRPHGPRRGGRRPARRPRRGMTRRSPTLRAARAHHGALPGRSPRRLPARARRLRRPLAPPGRARPARRADRELVFAAETGRVDRTPLERLQVATPRDTLLTVAPGEGGRLQDDFRPLTPPSFAGVDWPEGIPRGAPRREPARADGSGRAVAVLCSCCSSRRSPRRPAPRLIRPGNETARWVGGPFRGGEILLCGSVLGCDL
jgi:hypothetical protein